MSWTPTDFAEDTDRHYAHARSYDPGASKSPDADLQEAFRAVASAQDAAREVVKALAQNPAGLDAGQLGIAENNLLSVEGSAKKMREGFEFLKDSV